MAKSCSISGSAREVRTIRSSSFCATPLVRNSTSPSSVASICATAATTMQSTPGTRSAYRWRRSTARGRRGTTSSSPSAGPAVADVETVFRERWEDPAPLTPQPDRPRQRAAAPRRPHAEPAAGTAGRPRRRPAIKNVQLLRTYPKRRSGYPFAPDGERSVAHAYEKVVARAHSLIYVEDQYFWSTDIVNCFADGAARRREPASDCRHPPPPRPGRPVLRTTQPGRSSAGPRLRLRRPAAIGSRSTGSRTTPVPRCTCTPRSASSTTFGPRSARTTSTAAPGPTTRSCPAPCSTTNSTLANPESLDRFGDGARSFARNLRLELAREHLDREPTVRTRT